jgi:cell division cycle 2-like
MSEETASSTPKKRSRWEDDMPTEAVVPVLKKKKPKGHPTVDERLGTSPHVQVAQLSIASQPSSPRQPLARPLTTRSAFVPPRTSHPAFAACRSVYCYERLNHIEEGSYGVVFRARDKATGDIVAIKKLKLDEEKNGFPITSLREVMALMVCRHEHVVGVREIVVGDTLTQ